MITLRNISKAYRTRNGWNQVLDDINLEIAPGKNIGILGLNGSGKSTLLRIIGNIEPPDSGEVIKSVRTSWPIGFTGGFVPFMTGRENTKFIARIYGNKPKEIEEFVEDFSELEHYFDEPIRSYSAGMRGRLNFAVSMAMKFDCYLVDEGISTGDRRFADKYQKAFNSLRDEATMIMVSHQAGTIKAFCSSVAVIHNGHLTYYEDLEEGFSVYEKIGREPRTIKNRPRKLPKFL